MSTVADTTMDQQATLNIAETKTKVSYIDIAIIGSVSTGKTTLLNTIFGCNFGNMRIMRETMFPQVYIECDDVKEFNLEEIKKKNSQDNKVEFVEHKIPKIIPKQFYYKITDYPGIDDATKSAEFFSCLEKNINNHDIIIWLISLTSPLNTEGELKIKAVLDKHADRTVVCINKSDHLIDLYHGKLDNANDDDSESDDEDKEICTIIEHVKEQCSSYKNVFEITTLYAYIINSILLNKLKDSNTNNSVDKSNDAVYKLSKKEFNIVGSKLLGISWNSMTKKQRLQEMQAVCNINLLEATGYTKLLDEIDISDIEDINTSRFDRKFLEGLESSTTQGIGHKCYGLCSNNIYTHVYYDMAKYINKYRINDEIAKNISECLYYSINVGLTPPILYILGEVLELHTIHIRIILDNILFDDETLKIYNESIANLYEEIEVDRLHIDSHMAILDDLYRLFLIYKEKLYITFKTIKNFTYNKFFAYGVCPPFPQITANAIYNKLVNPTVVCISTEMGYLIHHIKNIMLMQINDTKINETMRYQLSNAYHNICTICTKLISPYTYEKDCVTTKRFEFEVSYYKEIINYLIYEHIRYRPKKTDHMIFIYCCCNRYAIYYQDKKINKICYIDNLLESMININQDSPSEATQINEYKHQT